MGSNEYWLFNYFRKNGIHHSFNNWNHRFPIIPEQKHHAVAMRPLRVKLLLKMQGIYYIYRMFRIVCTFLYLSRVPQRYKVQYQGRQQQYQSTR